MGSSTPLTLLSNSRCCVHQTPSPKARKELAAAALSGPSQPSFQGTSKRGSKAGGAPSTLAHEARGASMAESAARAWSLTCAEQVVRSEMVAPCWSVNTSGASTFHPGLNAEAIMAEAEPLTTANGQQWKAVAPCKEQRLRCDELIPTCLGPLTDGVHRHGRSHVELGKLEPRKG